MQIKNQHTTSPPNGNQVDSCLGSGRSGQAVTYAGRLLHYICPKCGRNFSLTQMQGLQTYQTLPTHSPLPEGEGSGVRALGVQIK